MIGTNLRVNLESNQQMQCKGDIEPGTQQKTSEKLDRWARSSQSQGSSFRIEFFEDIRDHKGIGGWSMGYNRQDGRGSRAATDEVSKQMADK